MRVTFDPAKRQRAWVERGLDFEDAEIVFQGTTVEVEDRRKDYGERRIICFGMLAGRTTRHVFSMRKANDREQKRLASYLEIEPEEG